MQKSSEKKKEKEQTLGCKNCGSTVFCLCPEGGGEKRLFEKLTLVAKAINPSQKTYYWVNKLYPIIAKKLELDEEFKEGDPLWVLDEWKEDDDWLRYYRPEFNFIFKYSELKEDDKDERLTMDLIVSCPMFCILNKK